MRSLDSVIIINGHVYFKAEYHIQVRHIYLSIKETEWGFSDLPSTQIVELSIVYMSWDNLREFSDLLCLCFPGLVYFSVFRDSRNRDIPNNEFFILPTLCSTLKTEAFMLRYFANCNYIEYIDLLSLNFIPENFYLYNNTFMSSLYLGASILTVHLSYEYSCQDIWTSIINIVEQMNHLEVLREVFCFSYLSWTSWLGNKFNKLQFR